MKVLLVVIDGAAPRVLGPALQTGRLPVMQRLAAAGRYHDACTTIFPSITPAATGSIVTGEYPIETGILGAAWFDRATGEVAYYGDDFWVIAREGFGAFLEEFLLRLNGDRLTAPTLFEMIEADGGSTASLNYLVFRGPVERKARVPRTLRFLPGVDRTVPVKTPSIVALGDFLTTRTMRGRPLVEQPGLLHRFGMDDASTAQLLCELAADKLLPDLTVAYFADNDFHSHRAGPQRAVGVLERVDRALEAMFDAAGGFDAVLKDLYVVITSDHGHCEILNEAERAAIRLDERLTVFRQAKLGRSWRDGDEIMICPNMRAAQVYFREPTERALRRAVADSLSDPRVEQAIYRGDVAGGSQHHFWIESAAAALEFWRGAEGPADAHARDAFDTEWSWRGDLAVIGVWVDGDRLVWGDFPNAFERVAGVLRHPSSATLWVTAKPGCEFELPGGAAHLGGGSHGALHALESLCPLIVAGPEPVLLPADVRAVDVAPLCLQLLGRSSPRRVGEGR